MRLEVRAAPGEVASDPGGLVKSAIHIALQEGALPTDIAVAVAEALDGTLLIKAEREVPKRDHPMRHAIQRVPFDRAMRYYERVLLPRMVADIIKVLA